MDDQDNRDALFNALCSNMTNFDSSQVSKWPAEGLETWLTAHNVKLLDFNSIDFSHTLVVKDFIADLDQTQTAVLCVITEDETDVWFPHSLKNVAMQFKLAFY